jgi:hypothetical protein
MSEISRRRELYTGLTVAIELRARELAAEREHAELVQRASTIQDEAQELAEKQRRLALDRESVAAGELGKEMQEILKKLEPSRLDTLVPRLGGGVGAMGGGTVATLVEAIADYAVSEWRRLKARRARRQAGAAEAQLSDRDSRDERSGSDDS